MTEQVSGALSSVPAVSNYESLQDKPQINDVELSGNKTADELGLATKEAVEELERKFDNLVDGNEVAY